MLASGTTSSEARYQRKHASRMLGLLAACALAVATPGGSDRALLKSLDAARALPPCERCAAGLRAVRTDRSPNVVSLAMRLCRERRATVERLFARTAPEEAAYAALLDARLADGDHEAACAGALELLGAQLPARSRSLGPVLRACCDAERADLAAPLWDAWRAASDSQKSDDWSACVQLHARRQDATRLAPLLRAARARGVALDAECVGALLRLSRIDGEARALGPADVEYHALLDGLLLAGGGGGGLLAGAADGAVALERTVAILKPDAVAAGLAPEIEAAIAGAGFRVIARRRYRLDDAAAREFLECSWGSALGDPRRRFVAEMVNFYASGDIVALLLERADAIAVWRALLGPGDPAAARREAPLSLRARFGSDRQRNAAHGADSGTAARREIELLFGEAAT